MTKFTIEEKKKLQSWLLRNTNAMDLETNNMNYRVAVASKVKAGAKLFGSTHNKLYDMTFYASHPMTCCIFTSNKWNLFASCAHHVQWRKLCIRFAFAIPYFHFWNSIFPSSSPSFSSSLLNVQIQLIRQFASATWWLPIFLILILFLNLKCIEVFLSLLKSYALQQLLKACNWIPATKMFLHSFDTCSIADYFFLIFSAVLINSDQVIRDTL